MCNIVIIHNYADSVTALIVLNINFAKVKMYAVIIHMIL